MGRAMRVLIAFERTGVMRRAFAARGHDAWSCDLHPAWDGCNQHLLGDVRLFLNDGWDLLVVMHIPCTRLCNSGVRWLIVPPGQLNPEHYSPEMVEAYAAMTVEDRLAFMWRELDAAADLFSTCWNAPIKRVAVENPVMHRYARERLSFLPKPQIVQPWWFGAPFFKATGFYLRELPRLEATNRLVPPLRGTAEHKAWSRVHRMPPSPNRAILRAETFPELAEACADQWGGWALEPMDLFERLAA